MYVGEIMKYFSMFSGVGGFEIGILYALRGTEKHEHEKKAGSCERQVRVEPNKTTRLGCIGFSEIDKYAIQIYEKHFKGHKNYGNCTEIKWQDVPDFELLVGGFPCQSFSIAGKRGGFKDTRGTLFFEIARCLREKQPRLFLLENVKGLLSHDKGNTFLTIITTLDELGYDLQWQVLNSKNFGVPQNRERVFIVGHLRGTSRPEVFPIGVSTAEHSQKVQRVLCPTLKARDYKDGGKWLGKIRRLTPTEAERLQGFPDGWTRLGISHDREEMFTMSDTQRYKCLGNAVTVNVIEAIIKHLFIG
jgi:DNA (cytosine-5)-methyltransferase 1